MILIFCKVPTRTTVLPEKFYTFECGETEMFMYISCK